MALPTLCSVGAAAVFTPEGKQQVNDMVAYYLDNAKVIRTALQKAGFEVFGGVNGPYVWSSTPNGVSSWDFFDQLLHEKNIVTTPGWASDQAARAISDSQHWAAARKATIEAMSRF